MRFLAFRKRLKRIILMKGENSYSLDAVVPKEKQPYYIAGTAHAYIAKEENYEIIPSSAGVTWFWVFNIKTGQYVDSWTRLIEVVDREKVCLNKEYAELYTIGDTVQLTADVTPINVTDKSVTWSSSDEKIATVSQNGLVTAKGKGSVDIIATSKINKVQAVCRLNVKDTHQEEIVRTSKVLVKERSKSLKKGEKYQIKASVLPTTSQEKITYSSSNKKIVTVNQKGKIIAKKKGKAIITVKSGKKKVTVKITVK